MRDVLFKLLTILLCVVLCLNFVRFFVLGDRYTQVDGISVLQALSQIGADPTPLYQDLYETLDLFLTFSNSFSDLFTKASFTSAKTTLKTIVNFFTFCSTLIINSVLVISKFIVCTADAVKFGVGFLKSILNFFNVVIGTVFDTRTGVAGGFSGGGFGGRR